MWQYMRTHKPETATGKDILEFFVEFSRWKKNLIGNGEVENEYLMAHKGRLFEIISMFVHEVDNYIAIGAGMDFSTAALYLGHSPEEAVKVACDLSCMVSEPIVRYEMRVGGE